MPHCLHIPRTGQPRTAALALALAVATLLSSGCLHLRQELQIHADGTLTAVHQYSVPAELLPSLRRSRGVIENWQGLDPGPDLMRLNWFDNQAAVERHFSVSGVEVVDYRRYEQDGRYCVDITVKAANAWSALQSGLFGSFVLERTETGNVLFRADVIQPPLPQEPHPEQLQRLRELCRGLRLRLDVRVPTEVLETTAAASTAQLQTWLFEPDRDPIILLQTPPVRLVFDGSGLDWVPND